jgi:hypothetical protein
MGSERDSDRVRLTVPADPTMVDVVRAAIRSLGARAGLGEAAVEATRTSVSEAFLELLPHDEHIVLEARAGDTDLEINLTAGSQTRRIEASRSSS